MRSVTFYGHQLHNGFSAMGVGSHTGTGWLGYQPHLKFKGLQNMWNMVL